MAPVGFGHIRQAPKRAAGLFIINDEADMKVGFDQPFEPRLTERFPSALWVDDAPPSGAIRYEVRTVTASGVASAVTSADILHL